MDRWQDGAGMASDLYVWSAPRDLDPDRAEALVAQWEANGGDPARSPFEPSTDVGWFHRELRQDAPDLDLSSDAVPSTTRTPIWLSSSDEPPARIVAIRLSPDTPHDDLDAIASLGAKYDLVLFDRRNRRLMRPLDEMAAHARATFWPAGAIQAASAGGGGLVLAIVAWLLGIPVLSGVLVVIGGFLFVGAVYTFIHEGRATLRERRIGGSRRPDA
jgi:hypothetical protein